MHTRNRRILTYSFLLLFMMACRTYACNEPQTVPLAGGGSPTGSFDIFSCQGFTQLSSDPHPEGFTCKLTCPTGIHTFDLYDKDLKEFVTMTLPQVQAQYCPGGVSAQQSASDPQPTEPPTEEPTEEPASTEAPTDPAPLKPYLTGAFTTCDNVAGYVNFTIAENAPAYDPATFKITFNGYPVICTPAASNSSVLTCLYPPPSYAPPAGVQVFIGEELVNEFDFNGGEICNPIPQPNTTDATEEPAPTEAPTEPPSTEPAPTDGD